MTIPIVLTLVCVILFLIAARVDWGYGNGGLTCVLFGAGSGTLAVIAWIALPVVAYDARIFRSQFEEVRFTVEESRKTETIESAALKQTIIEWNTALIGWQKANRSVIGAGFVPDFVDYIKPIQ